MAQYSSSLDEVFAALADPTRRAVVGALGRGPASVGELARSASMTLAVVHEARPDARALRADPHGEVRAGAHLHARPRAPAASSMAGSPSSGRSGRAAPTVSSSSSPIPRSRHDARPRPGSRSADRPRDPCPAHRVWKAWTDPLDLARWWLPAPTQCRVEQLDVVPGGAFVTSMSDDGIAFGPHLDACFVVVEPGERIVFTNALDSRWRPANPAPVAMTAEITFRDHPARHRLPRRRPARRRRARGRTTSSSASPTAGAPSPRSSPPSPKHQEDAR